MVNRYFPALTYRNFRIFWLGQLVSLVGTWMQNTILPYLAYRLTNQPIYLGAIGFAASLPAFFLTLPGGVLVERLDRRKTVIAMQAIMMIQAFILAYLTITGIVNIWHILALSLVLGVANSIEITARQSMFVDLVDRDVLPNAIVLNSAVFNAARVLGPTLTTPFLILLKNAGEGWAFFANGVSYLVVIGGLILIKTRPHENQNQEKINWRKQGMQDFIEGQQFVFKTPAVLLLILMVIIPSFIGFPFTQLIPVFARDVLKTAADTSTIVATRNSLLVTSQGIGALIGAIFLAVLNAYRKKGRLLLAGQIVFGIGLVGLSQAKTMAQAAPFMIMLGWGIVTQLALTNSLIQLLVSDELRGRVVSTYLWAVQGTAPFGSLFLGWLAQQMGAPTSVLIGGVVCLIGYISFHIYRPIVHKITI